jgi:hypothetical protein
MKFCDAWSAMAVALTGYKERRGDGGTVECPSCDWSGEVV